MLNIAYTHVSVVLVIFHYYMLQKQSNSRSLCSMTSLVVSFSNQIELNIVSRKARQLQKFCQRSYTVILTDLSNAIRKLSEKISFHRHFKKKLSGIVLLFTKILANLLYCDSFKRCAKLHILSKIGLQP